MWVCGGGHHLCVILEEGQSGVTRLLVRGELTLAGLQSARGIAEGGDQWCWEVNGPYGLV